MNAKTVKAGKKGRERGSSLFIVAAAMLALVGLTGLGIDLVALYLGKSEAQRAADAAALAGAQEFVLFPASCPAWSRRRLPKHWRRTKRLRWDRRIWLGFCSQHPRRQRDL